MFLFMRAVRASDTELGSRESPSYLFQFAAIRCFVFLRLLSENLCTEVEDSEPTCEMLKQCETEHFDGNLDTVNIAGWMINDL
ncbi:hypothetical protein F2P81_018574 [Scophthalmus maximus]|uniref:Uncharacterized protein n=1 Tax=Scophthalmus maximus TaxID=52904 RepID=A0A6A4SA58_SCOMX|nr:hypothetical protein F2P81_018574 [Scophthalmus maximus]